MTDVRSGAGSSESQGSAINIDDALRAEIDLVLRSERVLWRAAERLVKLSAPAVEQVCRRVSLGDGFTAEIAVRAVVRRAHDALAAITVTVGSPARASARVYLRSMTEDLIFAKWLLGLTPEIATQYVQANALVDALKAVAAQQNFLPSAYRQLGAEPPSFGFGDVTSVLEQVRGDLANLYRTQGWGKRGPSVRAMAEAAGLVAEYEFFYFLSSKAVHANLHEMARMVWGNESTVDISSDVFAGVHADLAVVYGVWLFHAVLSTVADRIEPIGNILDSPPYSIWLAMILVGPARNGQLPLLIHPEELRWHNSAGPQISASDYPD